MNAEQCPEQWNMRKKIDGADGTAAAGDQLLEQAWNKGLPIDLKPLARAALTRILAMERSAEQEWNSECNRERVPRVPHPGGGTWNTASTRRTDQVEGEVKVLPFRQRKAS